MSTDQPDREKEVILLCDCFLDTLSISPYSESTGDLIVGCFGCADGVQK